jgi:hypothetical protein
MHWKFVDAPTLRPNLICGVCVTATRLVDKQQTSIFCYRLGHDQKIGACFAFEPKQNARYMEVLAPLPQIGVNHRVSETLHETQSTKYIVGCFIFRDITHFAVSLHHLRSLGDRCLLRGSRPIEVVHAISLGEVATQFNSRVKSLSIT